MELGKVKLLRSGVNALRGSVHPSLGLAWTDGKQLLLSGLPTGEAARLGSPVPLGCFEHVYGLCWGPVDPALPALLAVQHKKHVSVWQVSPAGREDVRPACSRLCEREEPFAILPQGCVWHPTSETLVLLTKRDACLLYSLRSDARCVRADIRGSGLVHCAAWTADGLRLVLAVGTALHSYLWDEPSRALQPCGFSHVLDVGGYVCAVEAVCDARVLVATELPLDRVCGLNAGAACFDIPAAGDPASSSSPNTLRARDADDGGAAATTPGARSPEPRGGIAADDGPVDLTHLLAHHRKSDPGPLIRLKHRDLATGGGGGGVGDDSSHLLLVTLDQKATTTRKVRLPGLLVPDLLAYDAVTDTVAVASNTSGSVLVYSLSSRGISPLQHVVLGRDERPKGLCFLARSHALAMLVGRQKQPEPAFLPCASTERYALRLVVRDVAMEGSGCSSPRAGEGRGTGHAGGSQEMRQRATSPRRLVEELSRSLADERSSRRSVGSALAAAESRDSPSGRPAAGRFTRYVSLPLESFECELTGGMAALGSAGPRTTRVSSEPHCPGGRSSPRGAPGQPGEHDGAERGAAGRAASPGLGEADDLLAAGRTLPRLWERLDRVQADVGEVRQLVLAIRSEQQAPVAAPGPPQWVWVRCLRQGGSGDAGVAQDVATRCFLLCGGFLRLDVLQNTFRLSSVEMLFDAVWLVLGRDRDGFIPVAFQHEQELLVREASAAPHVGEPRGGACANPTG